MDAYVEEIRNLENKFSGLEIHHVDRDNNMGVDVLSKHGSTRAAVPPGVFVHELHHPLVKVQSQQATDMEAPATIREVLIIEEDWRIQFIDFIKEFKLPPHVDPKSAKAAHIIRRSKGFILVGDNLYKRSASGILMKCVTLEEGKDILREIHEGVCGNHAASKDTSRQGLQVRILLANSRFRCRRPCQTMPRLSILWQKDSRSSTQPDNNPSIMAVRLLEFGHDRTINRRSRRIQSCAGSSRQVHQVDRVQAHCQDLIR